MSTYPIVWGVRLPKPIRRTQYQLEAYIEREGMVPESCYDSAKQIVMLWLEEKTSEMAEIKTAIRGKSEDDINISYNGITIRTVSLIEESTLSWALNFIHPDNAVPTRLWETQVVICLENGKVKLFTENSFLVSVEVENPVPTVPGFIRALAEQIGVVATYPLGNNPWTIEEASDIDKLYEIITDANRYLPVIVISSPDYHRWPIAGYAPKYIISGDEVAKRCFGRCIVVQLSYHMGFRWSDKVGRSWAVFDGGVRIYMPGLNFDDDDIFDHTLYSKNKILGWTRDNDELSPCQCYERYLISEIKRKPTMLASSAERVAFTTLLQRKIEQQKEESITNKEQIRLLYEEQINAIKEEKDYHEALAEDAYKNFKHYEHECDVLRERNYNLECLVEQLQDALKNTGKDIEDIIDIPDNYDEMAEWCSKYLSGKLEFTPRARRAIGKDIDTLYSDVSLVYRCLLFLANEYRNTILGKEDRSVVDKKLKDLQVENRPSVTETQAGRYEDDYYYTDSKGIKRFVDMHLTRGTSRDTRNILRIYYYWDDTEKKVVVVSLTKHLTTSST